MNANAASQGSYDVVIVGGGVAGLSAAVSLARFRRSVLVIDAGRPRNAPAAGVHNFVTRDGLPPTELTSIGRAEVRSFGGEIVTGTVSNGRRDGDHFVITVGDKEIRGRRLLVASGVVDRLPDIPGVAQRWGRDVLHCPYCHGWEVRDQRIGVIGCHPGSAHQAQMFRQLSDTVTLFRHVPEVPEQASLPELSARGITVVDGPVTEVVITDDRVTGIRLADGSVHAVDAVVVPPVAQAQSPVLDALGAVRQENPMGAFYLSDETGLSEIPGVWLAGNVTDLPATVVVAAAGGGRAAGALNADLVAEDIRLAVATGG